MNINTNTIIAIVVVVVIIIGGLFLLKQGSIEEADEATQETEEISEDTTKTGETVMDEGTPSSSTDTDPDETTSSDTVDETTETTSGGSTQTESEPVSTETPAPDSTGDVEETVVNTATTVTYTNSGYNPSTVTISAGDTVTFINGSSGLTWPASIFHPTHRIYPGSSIQKCGTSEEGSIFDSCGRIIPGDSWSFTFNEVGSWKYHNHLSAGKTGTIVVE